MNYLRLSSRVDAVASRVESAVKMNLVTKQMAGVVKGMDASLQSMDVEKVRVLLRGMAASTHGPFHPARVALCCADSKGHGRL